MSGLLVVRLGGCALKIKTFALYSHIVHHFNTMADCRQMSSGNSVFWYLENMLKEDSPQERQEVYKNGDHSSQLLQGLWANYQEGRFSDVTLVTDGKQIKAHKIVLGSFSLFFKGLFDSCWQEQDKGSVVIRDINEPTLRTILNFAYSGKLEVNTSNVLNVLAAADFLQLPSDFVKTSCGVYLKKLVNHENCLAMLLFADKFNAVELENHLVQYVSRYFYQISQLEDFLELPVEVLIHLLQSECLVVDKGQDFLPSVAEQERVVLETVLLYASRQSKEGKPVLLVELLKNVRLLLLLPSYLDNLHSSVDLFKYPEAKLLITSALNSHEDGASTCMPELWSQPRKSTKMSESHCNTHACGYIRPEQSIFDHRGLVGESWDVYLKGMKIFIRRWDGRPVIGGLQTFYSNGESSLNGSQDAASEIEEFQLEDGERIVKIQVNSGWMVDHLEFHTNKGRILGPYGGPGGNSYTEEPKGLFGFLAYIKGAVVFTQGKLGITSLRLVWRQFQLDCSDSDHGNNDAVDESNSEYSLQLSECSDTESE